MSKEIPNGPLRLIADVVGAPNPGAYSLYSAAQPSLTAPLMPSAMTSSGPRWLERSAVGASMAPLDDAAAKTMRGVEIVTPGSLPKAAFRDGITGPATEWECLTQTQRNRWFESEEKRKALQ